MSIRQAERFLKGKWFKSGIQKISRLKQVRSKEKLVELIARILSTEKREWGTENRKKTNTVCYRRFCKGLTSNRGEGGHSGPCPG